MRIDSELKLDFADVLIRPKRSTLVSRKDVDLTREFHFKWASVRRTCVPIVSSNMVSVTTEAVANALGEHSMLACMPKRSNFVNPSYPDNLIYSFGLNDPIPAWGFLCLDVPNGYIEVFLDEIKRLRDAWPQGLLITGNVVTPEMTEALILAGADIVKVGLGSGAACTTRLQTGVGYPQLSAVIECADAAHGLGGHIMSDGGCVVPGDVVKAFGAGADFIMLGSMLAGCSENGPDFYGSASKRAVELAGGLKDYRATEGGEFKLPPRGSIHKVLQEIEGGLRSACAYVGAQKLKELPKRTTFIRVVKQANDSLQDWRLE